MIPDDWEVLELQEVTERFIGGGTPSTENPAYWNGDIPWMRGAWISDRYVQEGEKMITKEGLENSSTNLVPANNVLVATRVSIGNIAVNKIDIAISQDLTGVVIDTSKADINYIFWALKAKANQLVRLNQGTAIKGILRKDLRKLKVALPTLEEQKRISEIIGRVDEISQVTRHLVGSCMNIKKGLMQRLLTRGIGHTRFKKTKIGEFPESWLVVQISAIGKVVTGTTPSTRNPDFYENKHVWVRPGDLGESKYITKSEKMLSSEGFRVSRRLPKDSVLVTCIGATIGKMGLAGLELATNQQINSVICNSECNPHYLYYYFNGNIDRIRTLAGTTAIPIVNKSNFEDIWVPIPDIEEQMRISSILSTVDECIEIEMKMHNELGSLKKGLMQVLLTGKVRVKI